jgi:cyclopropane fatty-acyl-phospholipid synthase-like methyltransferase
MNQFAKFWDKQAERYAKSPVQDEASYQKKLQKSREYFLPEMEVLEFGCGTGSTALLHAPFVKHILATDVSANMIQISSAESGIARREKCFIFAYCL